VEGHIAIEVMLESVDLQGFFRPEGGDIERIGLSDRIRFIKERIDEIAHLHDVVEADWRIAIDQEVKGQAFFIARLRELSS
jgi:hypothetical protein